MARTPVVHPGRGRALLWWLMVWIALGGSMAARAQPPSSSGSPSYNTPSPHQSATAPVKDVLIKLMVLGDSLTAGYGLKPGEGFTDQLQAALRNKGYNVQVINAGVSGDTTTDGLARLDWILTDRPDAMIVELGANDALRGIDPRLTRANLAAILKALRARHIPVLLAGMKAPPNMGPDYTRRFDAIYPDLAKQFQVPLYPFFLDGVATRPDLNQADGMHPDKQGVAIVVQNILPSVRGLLATVAGQAQ